MTSKTKNYLTSLTAQYFNFYQKINKQLSAVNCFIDSISFVWLRLIAKLLICICVLTCVACVTLLVLELLYCLSFRFWPFDIITLNHFTATSFDFLWLTYAHYLSLYHTCWIVALINHTTAAGGISKSGYYYYTVCYFLQNCPGIALLTVICFFWCLLVVFKALCYITPELKLITKPHLFWIHKLVSKWKKLNSIKQKITIFCLMLLSFIFCLLIYNYVINL